MRKLVVLALAFLAPVNAWAGEPDYPPFETLKLVDGVRLMATPPDYMAFAASNVVLIEQADGIVVVDSGATRGDGDQIVRYIRSFTKKPVKALVFTHWHNDHLAGASQLRAAWPQMRVIATDATRKGIDGPAQSEGMTYKPNAEAVAKLAKQLDAAAAQADKLAADPKASDWVKLRYTRMAREYRAGRDAFEDAHFVAPTEILRDEIVIDDPRLPVRIQHLGRANTDGDAIVWLPNQRLVAAGDVVVAPIPFGFGSYPGDWVETLGKVKALGFDVLVPGHGLPQQDAAYLDRLIATLNDIRAQVGKLAAEGLTLEQVRAKLDFSAQIAIFAPTPRRKAGFEGLWLHPMVENAYKEAKGIPIIQGGGELPGD